jgi:hypothetical protein
MLKANGGAATPPRPAKEEVVAKVEAWLQDPGNVSALQKTFEAAEELGASLAERSKAESVDQPISSLRRP